MVLRTQLMQLKKNLLSAAKCWSSDSVIYSTLLTEALIDKLFFVTLLHHRNIPGHLCNIVAVSHQDEALNGERSLSLQSLPSHSVLASHYIYLTYLFFSIILLTLFPQNSTALGLMWLLLLSEFQWLQYKSQPHCRICVTKAVQPKVTIMTLYELVIGSFVCSCARSQLSQVISVMKAPTNWFISLPGPESSWDQEQFDACLSL